jgi:hypothetical protein
MANEFDPYREALVVEKHTVWPEGVNGADPQRRAELEGRLHAAPQEAASLEYVRLHTGFARQITVTEADLERLG